MPCLLDYGLAKAYVDKVTGQLRKPSTRAEFRGSASWASVNAYSGKELGRHDDLWSLLYVLVDFVSGTLPWKDLVDHQNPGKGASDDRRSTVEKEKIRCRKNPSALVEPPPAGGKPPLVPGGRRPVATLPQELADMSRYLDTLDFHTAPDYERLRGLFRAQLPAPVDQILLDWEPRAAEQAAAFERGESWPPAPAPAPSQTYAAAVAGGGGSGGAAPEGHTNGHHAQAQEHWRG